MLNFSGFGRFHGRRRAVSAALAFALGGLASAVPTQADAAQQTLSFTIDDRRLRAEPETVKVRQGDDVTLRWYCDHPIELHLHGYDIEVNVSPAAPGVMAFKASIAGRFPVEAHGPGRHRPLLYLEVHP